MGVLSFQFLSLDLLIGCNYNDYISNSSKLFRERHMEKQTRKRDIQLVPIGNSKGIRIPKGLLQKYGFTKKLLLEETEKGLLLQKKEDNKLSWEETYKAMADEKENWDDFDATLQDGLEDEGFEL
jgi:antitoxin MazE